LAERLRARAPEIQQAILDRLDGLEGGAPVREPDYLHGLNEAVRKGVEYGIEVVAVGAERAEPAPLALPAQVRLAARHRISLALVIRELRRDTTAGFDKVDKQLETLDEKYDRKFDRLTFHLLTGSIAMITALLGVIATLVVTLIHVL